MPDATLFSKKELFAAPAGAGRTGDDAAGLTGTVWFSMTTAVAGLASGVAGTDVCWATNIVSEDVVAVEEGVPVVVLLGVDDVGVPVLSDGQVFHRDDVLVFDLPSTGR